MKTTKKKSTSIQNLITWMMAELAGVTKQVEADQVKAAENFHKFLQWSQGAFEHASYQRMLKIYMDSALTALKNKKTAEFFVGYISDNLLNESQIFSSSSLQTHNLMDAIDRASKAKIINHLKQALKYGTTIF